MAVTLHDVARVASVSIKTVSNVVNGYQHVRPTTRQRVLDAIAELDYRPNMSARSLRSGKTGVICLAVPELRLNYFAELADAVIKAADRRSMVVFVEQTGGRRDRELELLSSARLRLTDGLILSPLGVSNEDAGLMQADVPIVLLGERIFNAPVDHVTMQNAQAARAATAHLIRAGRRKIALIGAREGEGLGSATLRVEGYVAALQDAGIAYDPKLVIEAGHIWHRENGAAATRELLDRGVDFDGMFCLNDTLAFGAIRELHTEGVRVPEDVAVIGFDNLDEASFFIPALSSVEAGMRAIAETAVTVLLDRLNERDDQRVAPHEIELPFSIVARESSPSL